MLPSNSSRKYVLMKLSLKRVYAVNQLGITASGVYEGLQLEDSLDGLFIKRILVRGGSTGRGKYTLQKVTYSKSRVKAISQKWFSGIQRLKGGLCGKVFEKRKWLQRHIFDTNDNWGSENRHNACWSIKSTQNIQYDNDRSELGQCQTVSRTAAGRTKAWTGSHSETTQGPSWGSQLGIPTRDLNSGS